MRSTNDQGKAHTVHGNGVLYLKNKFGCHLAITKCPLYLALSNPVGEGTVCPYELRLVKPKVERFFKPYTGHTIFPVEGGNDHILAKGKFRNHHGKVLVYRPVKNPRAVR